MSSLVATSLPRTFNAEQNKDIHIDPMHTARFVCNVQKHLVRVSMPSPTKFYMASMEP